MPDLVGYNSQQCGAEEKIPCQLLAIAPPGVIACGVIAWYAESGFYRLTPNGVFEK
jgi:hypothetical protein